MQSQPPKAPDAVVFDKPKNTAETLAILSPGIRYFKERQIRAGAEKELFSRVKSVCSAVAGELSDIAANSRQRKIVNLSKRTNENQTVVNWAFPVDRSIVRDFLTRVEAANSKYNTGGLFFGCSGPWPPYSFCPSLEMEAEA
jgi:hypothetical protein